MVMGPCPAARNCPCRFNRKIRIAAACGSYDNDYYSESPVSQAQQPAVYHSAVRQQLEKILIHGLFTRSERMGRFLRLAVELCLKGRAGDLKEYLIGVEVFDRKEVYDPRVDPIVRVEARRLRSKLKAYYEGDGRGDPVIIEFVSGSYAPQIRPATQPPATQPPPAARSTEPGIITVAVLPFVDLSSKPGHEYFSDGLTEELIHALTKVPGMRVVAWNTATQLRGRQQDIHAIRDRCVQALQGAFCVSNAPGIVFRAYAVLSHEDGAS